MNEIIRNEITLLTDRLIRERECACKVPDSKAIGFSRKYFMKRPHRRNAVVVSFWSSAARLAAASIAEVIQKDAGSLLFVDLHGEPSISKVTAGVTEFHVADTQPRLNECAYYVFVDVNSSNWNASAVEGAISSLASSMGEKCCLIIAIQIPDFPSIPNKIKGLAEREFAYYIENLDYGQMTEPLRRLIRLEKFCRSITEKKTPISLLRIAPVFGPNCADSDAISLRNDIRKAFCDGVVNISDADELRVRSVTYIRDAVFLSLSAERWALPGHIYHIKSYDVVPADLKRALASRFSDRLGITDSCAARTKDSEYACLMDVKRLISDYRTSNKRTGKKTSLYAAVEATACDERNEEPSLRRIIAPYGGRLSRLKSIEIEMLTEIDRICQKNNIPYFVAAGSLLGVIRNGKSIAWDDDLDIAMTREAFEKFRSIAPVELDTTRFIYSSPDTDPDVHYFFDKIRLRDSYFSSLYASKNSFHDGVFLDIIIYDKTSDSPFWQKIHALATGAIIMMLNHKWTRYGSHGYSLYARLTGLMLRIIPWRMCHRISEKVFRFYERKNTHSAYDGVGLHLYNLGFPAEYLEKTERKELDGVSVPVPNHAEDYLRFFYGNSFRPLPPICRRVGAHAFARLDLGEHLFETHSTPQYRKVDPRGELFEKTISEVRHE